jgi:GT2 family glycosyltransferase
MEMDKMETIGVVIVTWNSGRYVTHCIEHLLAQSRAADRILVLDNHSADDSLARAASFPGVQAVPLKTNVGFAAANNLAVGQYLDTDWVVLLNPDAFAEPDWLAALEAAAETNPDYGIFGSCMLSYENPAYLDGTGDCYHICGMAWRRGHKRPVSSRYKTACDIFSPCAAAAMYKRDLFLAQGGFDEDMFCYFEDVDLGFRMNLAGHKCRYVPDAVVRHVGSSSLGENSDFALYHGHRNLVWCYAANMPGALFWFFLPLHILFNVVSICYMTLHGHGRILLKAKQDALFHIGKSLKKRRKWKGHAIDFKRLVKLMDVNPFYRC